MVTVRRLPRRLSSMETTPETSARSCHFLGLSCLKQFLDSGKTLGNIVAGNAAGVEGTHCQLGAGFADGLGPR
jgi:hypothetical protein